MKKTLLALATAAACALPLAAFAQAAEPAKAEAPKPEPEFSLTANVTLASSYAYRGIAQTNERPAIQGGFDFVHKSGFYLGNWNSNISWLADANPGLSAPIEMDFYGGYKFEAAPGLTIDLGALQYYYPMSGAKPANSPNTTELYVGAGWGPLSFKYSQAVTDLFGFVDSKNSYYLDGGLNYEVLPGLALVGHVGYQKVKGSDDASYTDWKLGANYTWEGWTLGAAYVDTNASDLVYTGPVGGKNLGKSKFIATVGRSF